MQRLGLDLGSSSIGWALRKGDKIEKRGVITFQSGMVKGQSGYSSPTKDRREARSKRGLIRARKYRKWALLKVLLNDFVPLDRDELENWSKYKKGQVRRFPENEIFLKWLACDFAYEGGDKFKNPYELRVKALNTKLSKHEFGRALYHLIQRRGYKNIGENDEEFDIELAKKDNETKKQIERRNEEGFAQALASNRTIAQALLNEFLNKNKRARGQYPLRREYKAELEELCKSQGYDITKNHKGKYKNEFVQALWEAIIWQRDLKSQKGNIGKCTLEPSKSRCPISHPIFEIFRAWSFINTIKYVSESGEKVNVSQKVRGRLFEEVFLKKDRNFKFEDIRKFLDKQLGTKKKYNYPINRKGEYDSTVSGMPVCHGLIKVLGNDVREAAFRIHNYNIGNAPKTILGYSLYDLWHILFEFDEAHLKDFAIEKLKIGNVKNKNGEEYNPFAKLKNSLQIGYADLSLKAMCKIIPFLQEGYLYNEAVLLAKIPELLGERWKTERIKILEVITQTNNLYNWNKKIIGITNNLIDQYKGDVEKGDLVKAWKDYTYTLNNDDIEDIRKACVNYFGEESWKNKVWKEQVLEDVKKEYQYFFWDIKRAYRKFPTLIDIFKDKMHETNLELNGDLYHHSQRKNLYGSVVKDKKTGLEILPEARIDSIKNPMFNKTMSILRKLVNELIKNGSIDEDTEIVIEVARELNDNNKRAAIERYQREREGKREKYRRLLAEFKEKKNRSVNVEESIVAFELRIEQPFEETENDTKEQIKNESNNQILKEKDALKRYELWMEQKGQCMYTGKMISLTQLFSNEIDIEHTIPRSLLPDNTMTNQTVCYHWYNNDKKQKQLPKQCDNYYQDKDGWGTRIEERLDIWKQERDKYKKLYEDRLKPKGNEDEAKKNKRIQDKHYFKMHYDYWKDKVERFESEEIKDSWARRQLVDTQMVSKYAREFLKTFFKKVVVQKGSVTAAFRKIYKFQEGKEIKSRNKHTHHAIDAAVLTLIPINSSYRDRWIKEYYEAVENFQEMQDREPYKGFNSQNLIKDIEGSTLIVNYKSDKISKNTYKNVRKRGKLQKLKDKQGKFVLDKDGKKNLLKAKGDTVRSTLFKDTFLAKIKDVERDNNGKPIRENGTWKYKRGKDEFIYTVRKPVNYAQSKIEDIIDPIIRELVRKQKGNAEVKDYQGNIIRHVRMKARVGREVKERINYRSKYEHKNKYYAASDSIPYAILIQKSNNGIVERKMVPIASIEVARAYKKLECFDIEQYIEDFYPDYKDYPDKRLLKVGQKVIVLKDDGEYERRYDNDFQMKRLYVITQFSESIWMKYHLAAQSKDEIKAEIGSLKDQALRKYEIEMGLPEVIEDDNIIDIKERKKDYEERRYRFDNLERHRFKRIREKLGPEKTKEIKKELDKFKAIPSSIELEGKTSLLKMSKSECWNFLYEGEDFEVSLLGEIKFS